MSLPPLKRNIIQGSMATEKKSKLIDIGKRKNTHSSFLIYLGCSFKRQFLVLKKMLNIIATNLSQSQVFQFSIIHSKTNYRHFKVSRHLSELFTCFQNWLPKFNILKENLRKKLKTQGKNSVIQETDSRIYFNNIG